MGIPPTIEIANLGMADSLILMVMALVVFGPRRLPQIGRQIGKLMYEFRKASNDFKFQMEEELRNSEEADRRKKEEEERQRQLAANPTAQLEASTSTTTETPAATEAPATSDDPYPYGGTYGEIAEAQAKAEDAYPTIQPPSTGETVPADRPSGGASEAQAESAPVEQQFNNLADQELPPTYAVPPAIEEQHPVQKENDVKQAAVEDSDKTIEPAAKNG
jgi:sec-independent protein translocase protein TatB